MACDPLSPERYREIHEAHARDRRLGPAERAAFLEELGREDAGLRAEVESLLAHEGSTKDPFAEVIGRTAAEILQDEAVVAASLPKRVGGYWVLGLLGEGAMGRVFEALQPGTGRRVSWQK